MWGNGNEELLRRRSNIVLSQNLHNTLFSNNEDVSQNTTAAPSPQDSPPQIPKDRQLSQEGRNGHGRWGERDVGRPVNRLDAMAEFEDLKKSISRMSLQRTKSAASAGVAARTRSFARSSRHAAQDDLTRTRTGVSYMSGDEEAVHIDGYSDDGEDFDLGEFLRGGRFEKRTAEGGATKKVGVVFKHLTVKGVGSSVAFVKTLPQAIVGTFGPDLYRLLVRFVPQLKFGKAPPTRDLILDFTGLVRDGEMMLVLGRPGSGCTTLLKALANDRESYAGVEGEVIYAGITAEEQQKRYRGEVNYNPEDDRHLSSLTVWQTIKFALMNKTRKHDSAAIEAVGRSLLRMFGISHTANTLVGDEYVRGVSGGERKRVGVAETLATKSTVVCWDNSTRGLDASTALDYAKSLRIMTDISHRTTIVTLYQAGEGIYDLMDKVLVIEKGRMIYQGPAKRAKAYFLDLGFHCPDRQTTADFLTSIGDPNERQFQPGREASTPKTAEELEAVFLKSDSHKQILFDIEQYESLLHKSSHENTNQFKETVTQSKSHSALLPQRSSYTISFLRQVLACTIREFWLLWGDKSSLYTKFFIIISNALIVGSLFYGESLDTSGAFSRGGALFFSILFLGWLQLSELVRAVSGRVVVKRHQGYAFYRPSAVAIARVILDLPVLLVQVVIFGIIVYFMSDLTVDAGRFWIYMLFVYITTLAITALYRLFASLSPTIDDAVRFAGLALNLLVIFVGYVIPKQSLVSQVPWFGTWMYYLNPISYSYEAVLSNEFSGRTMQCSAEQLVPQGPGIELRYQGCALTGASLGNISVTGDDYIGTTFQYTRSHLWRNFGVVIAFLVLYVLLTAAASEIFSFAEEGGGAMIFKKTKKTNNLDQQENQGTDEEKTASPSPRLTGDYTVNETNDVVQDIAQSTSVFTWENVEYTVPYGTGTRKLLNKVNGYAKPGIMIALMGASGAGKTTLLNTLAQRQTTGVLTGDMLVDGKPLGLDFQRSTGFCEQMDLHESTATIREAIEFSALLRQDRNILRSEKLAYVDKIISLLELNDIEDAIISSLGVEQRKRLTIGVELAAKPSLLLFLDEPTSGLDSQSAFSIVRFLKKLSQAGQAIICTIHQPSSMLIQQFDMILALNPGGNTFYFGPVGSNGSAVVKYFADRGAVCPPSKNVAEFILETAAKRGTRGKDGKRLNWNKEWLQSAENEAVLAEIKKLKTSRAQKIDSESSAGSNAKEQNKQPKLLSFAASPLTQTIELTKRTFTAYSRDPSYLYSKLFVSVIIGLFNGFTFYNLGNSLAALQSRLFTAFLIIIIPPTIVNGVLPKFYSARALWEAREHPSRIYGWFAFCTAQVVAEIPMAIVSGTIYWLLWYLPTGLPRDASTAGYVYLMSVLFFLFQSSWGQWIGAFAPSFTIVSNVLPFFFVMFGLFNGIVRPYAQLPVVWRYSVYYMVPSTYWIAGVLASVLQDAPVVCAPGETTLFNPPPGQTCAAYAGDWLRSVGQGYLVNPDAHAACSYCPYATGAEYLATLNIRADEKWRDFGIFLMFVFTNWLLVYFFIYTTRVKGWTFGMGWIFGGFGKGVDVVKNFVQRKKGKETSEEMNGNTGKA